MAIPATMKALITVGDAPNATAPSTVKGRAANVQEVPVPTITDADILVKHIDLFSPDGAVVGCDYAGVVAQVGGRFTNAWKVGDRVAGWVHGGLYPDRGSFAQYLKVDGDLAWKMPDGSGQPQEIMLDALQSCRDVWSRERNHSVCNANAFNIVNRLVTSLRESRDK
ncbi:hypothetical protein NLG97_g6306 [Lecanicillium saksenae]|uniref:Uncharacterized protein n=1 Tax=Lecanicillium saksenae TaxID=468837 RepID=A0ACC1QRV4_9HYPO|nr:hypothetical protein NLG97_g6306 [Lecanicillium saksenae]